MVLIETTSAIRQPYEQLADHLTGEMRRGALRPGARLPAERDLAARLGVSRAVVREALGWLQVEGLVETRRGAGSFVVADVAARLASLDGALAADAGATVSQAGPAALLDARAALEPAVARLAALTMRAAPGDAAAAGPTTDPDVEALLVEMETNLDPTDAEQRRRWSDADRRFHHRFAVLTGNPVLVAMADAIERAMDEPLWQRLRDDSVATPGRTVLQLAEHRLIAAAVAEGDADAAADHVTRHLTRARQFMALTPDQED